MLTAKPGLITACTDFSVKEIRKKAGVVTKDQKRKSEQEMGMSCLKICQCILVLHCWKLHILFLFIHPFLKLRIALLVLSPSVPAVCYFGADDAICSVLPYRVTSAVGKEPPKAMWATPEFIPLVTSLSSAGFEFSALIYGISLPSAVVLFQNTFCILGNVLSSVCLNHFYMILGSIR